MKKYFITGGDGFVGFHLIKELLKDTANKITSYDAHKHFLDVDKSNWFDYQKYRIKKLDDFDGERLKRIRGDVTDSGRLREALYDAGPDIIIHLAALPIAAVSNKYPKEAQTNIYGTISTLLDTVALSDELRKNLERIVYTSSSMVYGDFLRNSQGEVIPAKEDQPLDPKGIYCVNKLAGEFLTRSYTKRFNIPHTIIRPSAVYGPTDCNRRVTEIFLNNALEGEPLTLDNGGLHQLDFTYVEDLVQGFVLASKSKNAINETFNLTRGEGRRIKDLAETIKNLIPEAKIVSKEAEVYRPNRGQLDISKARSLLGYNPQHSLEDGFEKYFDFVNNFNVEC